MLEENKRRNLRFLVVGTGLAIFLSFLFYSVHQSRTQNNTALVIGTAVVPQKQEQTNAGLPVRLKIPRIHVDASVEYVGLTPDGAMGVPTDPDTVAWFNLGPRPGETGSAVIDGHFGWKDGIPAVFDNVHKLHKGDMLSVEDKNGVTTTFVVRELRLYDQHENAVDVFSSSDGKAHLNLITCTGVWNKNQKSYSERLVVFTDKE